MKLLIRSLVVLAVAPLLLEGTLRLIDPWGVRAWQNDLYVLDNHLQADLLRGYVMQPGVITFTHWTASILPDSTRLVPDGGQGCTLVILGDSVTFGQSVNDDETWVNQIARTLPTVHIVNSGTPGYAIDNVIGAHDAFPEADAYLYLMFDNDMAQSHAMPPKPTYLPGILSGYLTMLTFREPAGLTEAQFDGRVNRLLSDDRLLIVAFDGPFGQAMHGHYPAIRFVPRYTQVTSRADPHPNAAGNREIAAAMLPIVRQAVADRCTATF